MVAVDVEPGSSGGGSGGEDPPSCSDDPARILRNDTFIEDGYRYLYIDATVYRTSLTTGVVEQLMYRRCVYSDGRVTGGNVWVPITDPDPRVRIPETVDEVRERVYAPRPALSPTVRGVVNLGMWLAVEEPAENPVVARASAGPGSWAETSATLESTTFDFGNGDVVVCAGVGDPIPESAKDSIEPSPTCGYTVRAPGTLTITITSTWDVVSSTSEGYVEEQADIVLSTVVTYDVIEIQTVGTSG